MKQPRACRIHHGDVQTAVWTLQHPETRRSVTLVGTYHLGDPQYYREITARVDEAEATEGLVQSEGTELADVALLTPLTEQEKRALAAKFGNDEDRAKTREALGRAGLVPELGMLARRPHWRYPDVDKLSQVRLIGDAAKTPENRARPPVATPGSGERRPQPSATALRRMYLLGAKLSLFSGRFTGKSVFRTALTNHQDQNAALDLLAIPGPATVLAIWGAGHLPGIRAVLERNGFELVDEQWLTAIAKIAPADEASNVPEVGVAN